MVIICIINNYSYIDIYIFLNTHILFYSQILQ